MATFSPFRDAQGAPKALADVTWADLAQLRDADEGFALEYKSAWTPSVRRKIPKVVASFCNSRGGWIVIGVADADRSVRPIRRPHTDFGQTVGELCRRHVSPVPRFDVRFVADPEDDRQGVALIRVEEGDFPPYVADGIVEVREGSTSGPATGAVLVELYGKATGRLRAVSEFCRRSVYYPDATGADGQPIALFDLYLFRMGRRHADAPSRDEENERVAAMRECFAQQGLDCHVQHAHDSLILRTSRALGTAEPDSALELFSDDSMKLSVPTVLLDGARRTQAVERLRALGLAVPPAARLIDARATLRGVTTMASLLDRYVRARALPWQGYAVAYELENLAGTILWSDDATYLDYARSRGPLFCGTTDCRSRVRYLDDGAHDSFRARQFAGSHFFEACGLPLGSRDPQDVALVDALLSTSHGARRP